MQQKAPLSGRRRLLRLKTCAHVSENQTLLPPPTTLTTELGGISSAHHSTPVLLPVASPVRSTFPITTVRGGSTTSPQSTGLGWRRGDLHGHDSSSTVISVVTHRCLPKAGLTLPRCRALSMLGSLFSCCFKQLLGG